MKILFVGRRTAVCDDGIHKIHGYSRLKITSDSNLKAVNSLLTGFQEPQASHLDLLSAFLPSGVILKE